MLFSEFIWWQAASAHNLATFWSSTLRQAEMVNQAKPYTEDDQRTIDQSSLFQEISSQRYIGTLLEKLLEKSVQSTTPKS